LIFRVFTLLAVIALGFSTWILSSPGRQPKTPADAAQSDRPGYYLKNALLTDFDAEGGPSVRIAAQRIDQIGSSSEVALHDVRVDYQSPNGQTWVMVGDLAHVQPGGKLIDLSGNVKLQGMERGAAGPAVIRTETLSYDVSEAIASTKSDVHIDFAQHTLNARGLVANLKEHTMRLESRVNGRFHP
jgi:lipopolysaccharide export system protein LptC